MNDFTKLIENLGFEFGNGYKKYGQTIPVKKNYPNGIVTTKDGEERKNCNLED